MCDLPDINWWCVALYGLPNIDDGAVFVFNKMSG